MTRREGNGREWFSIGIERSKSPVNLGTLWRSAVCLGATEIFTIGGRYSRETSDTVNAPICVPYYAWSDTEDFLNHRPFNVPLVGVELTADAQPLPPFTHPRRAMYLLGPEDGSLSKRALAACSWVVQIESQHCLNVATAGAIVMYDRQAKLSASVPSQVGISELLERRGHSGVDRLA